MIVHEESLLFGLLAGQKKQSEDVNLDSGKMWEVLSFFHCHHLVINQHFKNRFSLNACQLMPGRPSGFAIRWKKLSFY